MVMYGWLWKSECWLCTGRTHPKVGQIGALGEGRRHSAGSRLVGLVGFMGSRSLKAAPKFGPSAAQRSWAASPDWWVWWVLWGRGASTPRRNLGSSAAQRSWAASPDWWVWWVLWGRGASRPRRDLGPLAGQWSLNALSLGGFGGFYGVVEPQGRAEICGHRLASPVSSAPMAAARIGHMDAGAGYQAGRGAPACSAFQPCAWGHICIELGAHP